MVSELKPYSLVLVGVIPSIRDLEIARMLGWYRIPFRRAPKVIDVDFLAFYQPSIFPPPEGSRINYAACVLGHELTTRAELLHDEADHPRAREEYYKVSIGPLQRLSHPIEAGNWKRITFLYTTGEYLLQARKVQDLVVHSDERAILWSSLRERTANPPEQAENIPVNLPDSELNELLGYFFTHSEA